MNNKLSNIGKMTIKCTALGDVWPLKAQNSIHFIVIFAHWVNRSAPRCYFIILVFLLCNVRLFYSLWRTRFTRQGETSQMWSNFACLLIFNCLLDSSPQIEIMGGSIFICKEGCKFSMGWCMREPYCPLSDLQSATLLSRHYHYLRWTNLHVRRSVTFYIIFCL
jgi:hypothetical protein